MFIIFILYLYKAAYICIICHIYNMELNLKAV